MIKQLAEVNLDFIEQAVEQDLPGADTVSAEGATAGFGNLLSGLLSFLMTIGVIITLLYLLWGGLEWITSGGDKSKLEKARSRITSAVIGLIVLASVTAIFMMLQQFLGICVIKIGGDCTTSPTSSETLPPETSGWRMGGESEL